MLASLPLTYKLIQGSTMKRLIMIVTWLILAGFANSLSIPDSDETPRSYAKRGDLF